MYKKFSLYLALVLVLIILSCSSDRSRDIVYNAEKMYHTTIRHLDAISIKPELVTDEQIINIRSEFAAVAEYCNQNVQYISTDSNSRAFEDLTSVAFLATNQLTKAFYTARQFDSSIAVIQRFLDSFDPQGMIYLNSMLNMAQSYQSMGNIDKMLEIHGSLSDRFYPPVDNENNIITRILNLPLDAVSIYKLLQEEQLLAEAGKSAESYYLRLITDWPNTDLEIAATSNLARLYFDLSEWDKSIGALEKLKDSTGEVNFEAGMMIARITMDGLKKFDQAIQQYDTLLKRTTDTNIIPAILMYQGIANFEKKKYDACRLLMSQISDDYEHFFRANPVPQKHIAMAFDRMGDWVRAEIEFKWLIDNYSASEDAFNAFLIIADHFESAGNRNLVETWYRRAGEFYTKMINRYQGSRVEASAMSYQAEIARRQNNWSLAARILERIFNKFPQSDLGRRSIVSAASVYSEKLDNKPKADSIISRLKAELIPTDNSKNNNVMTDDNK